MKKWRHTWITSFAWVALLVCVEPKPYPDLSDPQPVSPVCHAGCHMILVSYSQYSSTASNQAVPQTPSSSSRGAQSDSFLVLPGAQSDSFVAVRPGHVVGFYPGMWIEDTPYFLARPDRTSRSLFSVRSLPPLSALHGLRRPWELHVEGGRNTAWVPEWPCAKEPPGTNLKLPCPGCMSSSQTSIVFKPFFISEPSYYSR